MAVLVGIYLLQVEPVEVTRHGASSWMANWTLLRSPSGNRLDWVALTRRDTASTFACEADALHAGEAEGATFARMLQGDEGLEPIRWEGLAEARPARDVVRRLMRSRAIH